MPRYYNQPGVALSYVSSYDPSFDNNLVNLQNQENQKAMMAVAGMSERESQIGDVFSHDVKGKQEVVKSFQDKINRVKEVYNNDLALAAPALSSAIAKERQNPWYQKNALYNQELERRQKLTDQFGPNILFNKNLPQLGEDKSLNDVQMEDIGFDYLNLQHVKQTLDQQFGALAKKKKDLGMKDIGDGFIAFGERMGLSDKELANLKSKNPEFLDNLLAQSGIQPTDQTRSVLSNYVSTWMDTNLSGQEDWREVADPYAMIKWKAKETAKYKNSYSQQSPGFPTGVQVNSTNSSAENLTGAKTFPDLIVKAKSSPYAKAILDKAYESMPENLRNKLKSYPTVTENDPLIKSIPNFNKLSAEQKQSFFADIDAASASYSDRTWIGEKLFTTDNLIGDILVKYGLASSNEDFNNESVTSGLLVKGAKLSQTTLDLHNFSINTKDGWRDRDKIISNFTDHIKKYDKWYDNQYSDIKDDVNKYMTDVNVMSFVTNTISGRDENSKKAINDTFYSMIKSSGVNELNVTDVKGNKANSDLKSILESDGKVDFVSMDLGSEYKDNKFKVTISNGTGAKKSSQEFIINPNVSNAREFSYNLSLAADSFAPTDALYSKLLNEGTFQKGIDKVTINDVRNANVYQQPLPQDNNPLAWIEKNKDGSFVTVNKDIIANGDPNNYYRQEHMTLTQAADDLLEQYGQSPEYRRRWMLEKLRRLQTNEEKSKFLESMLNMGTITDNEFTEHNASITSEEDYGN